VCVIITNQVSKKDSKIFIVLYLSVQKPEGTHLVLKEHMLKETELLWFFSLCALCWYFGFDPAEDCMFSIATLVYST